MAEIIYTLIFVGGCFCGMGLTYFIMKPKPDGIEIRILAFIKKYKLKCKAGKGAPIPAELLRQLYLKDNEKDRSVDSNMIRHFFSRHLKYYHHEDYDDGAVEVNGDSVLLIPPDPPSEYPKLPDGWEDCEI